MINPEYIDTYPLDHTPGYGHHFLSEHLYIETVNIRQNGAGLIAELNVYRPENTPIKSNINLALSNSDQRYRIALDLAKYYQDEFLPWGEIIEYVCRETIKQYRTLGSIDDMSIEPQSSKIQWAIDDFLPVNEPTTLFAPGGKGKSIFAALIAVMYQYGMVPHDLPLIPCQGNVLYLDWESNVEQHRKIVKAIKTGMSISEHQEIKYISCSNPITAFIEQLQEIVKINDIELGIIDSQMAATAGISQLNEAQMASEYYNCLHRLGCTTLTLDHVTKEGMRSTDGLSSPYGSVVKYNRARSIYELKSQQDTDSDHLEFVLLHHKFNLGKRQNPRGIAIDFTNNSDNELEKIEFSTCDIADNPVLAVTLTVKQRLISALKEINRGTTTELAEYIEQPRETVKTILNREKKTFVKIESTNDWGLLSKYSNSNP